MLRVENSRVGIEMKIELFHEEIRSSVIRHIDKTNAVYTDDIILDTTLTRETITRWLKRNGFIKTAGATSKRWQYQRGAFI